VSGIVKSHKGAITVESAVGKAQHSSILPILRGAEVKPFFDYAPNLPTGREHILLVDDEEPIAGWKANA